MNITEAKETIRALGGWVGTLPRQREYPASGRAYWVNQWSVVAGPLHSSSSPTLTVEECGLRHLAAATDAADLVERARTILQGREDLALEG